MELIQERAFPFADGDGAYVVSEYLLADGQARVEVRVENTSAHTAYERAFLILRETGAQSVMSAAAQGACDAIVDSYHDKRRRRNIWEYDRYDAPENAAYDAAYNKIYIPF